MIRNLMVQEVLRPHLDQRIIDDKKIWMRGNPIVWFIIKNTNRSIYVLKFSLIMLNVRNYIQNYFTSVSSKDAQMLVTIYQVKIS